MWDLIVHVLIPDQEKENLGSMDFDITEEEVFQASTI